MADESIEPSEIIIDVHGLPKDRVSRVNPWIRLLARGVDYALLLGLLLGLRLWLKEKFPSHLFEYLMPFEFFAWIPLEAVLLSTWGTTPGKFFLKTTLLQGRKRKLDFQTALRRSFNVWFRGLGMGIPVVNVLCLLVASHRLKLLGMTSWDQEANITVSHHLISRGRVITAAIFAGLIFIAYYVSRHVQ